MVFKCLAWIAELWTEILLSRSNNRKDDIRDLPDSVVFDILTRLPIESVFKCRRVCKGWLAITSSPHFAKMHLKRAPTNFFVQSIVVPRFVIGEPTWTKSKISLFAYEGKSNKISCNPVVVNEVYKSSLLVGSCDGTLVFRNYWEYTICNIVSQKKMNVQPPQPLTFFGIFFHALGRGYQLLFHGQRVRDHQYHIFIYNSYSETWRQVAAFSYPPRVLDSNSSVFLNDTLCWISDSENEEDIPCCRNSIIMFKTDTENFHFMDHPRGKCSSLSEHRRFFLMEMDGLLCCCVCHNGVISIYVLEDRSWMSRYVINVDLDEKKFPFYKCPDSDERRLIKLWKIENGELILYWHFRGLFRCHMLHNTVKKIDFPKITNTKYFVFGCSCTKSVVSLMAGYLV